MKLSPDDIERINELGFTLEELANMREEEVRNAIRERLPRELPYNPEQALDEGLIEDAYESLMEQKASKIGALMQQTSKIESLEPQELELFLERNIPALKQNLSLSYIPAEVTQQVSQTRFDNKEDVSQLVHLLVGHRLVDLHQKNSQTPKRRMLDLSYAWSNELLHASLQASNYCAFIEAVAPSIDSMDAVTSSGWVQDIPVLGGLGLLYLGRQEQLDDMNTNPSVLIYNIGPSIGAHESFITHATCKQVYDSEHKKVHNRGRISVVGGGQELKNRLARITPHLLESNNKRTQPALELHDSLDTLADKAYSHTFVFSPHKQVTREEVADRLGQYLTPHISIVDRR